MAKLIDNQGEDKGGEKQRAPKATYTPPGYKKLQHTGLADGAPDRSRIETK